MVVHKLKLVVLYIFFLPYMVLAQSEPFKVVLDPGHGGKDSGTQGTKRYKNWFEKDIVLSIALKVGDLLQQHEPDVEVIYTRKTDVFVELHKRGAIANKTNADLFVSIHANAASPSAKGTETYVLGVHRNESNLAVAKLENDVILLEDNYEKHYAYNPKDPGSLIGLTLMQEDFLDQSIRAAKLIEEKFTLVAERRSKGVKQAGFVVLHQSYMPSVLIEVGFMSNTEEEDYLRTETGRDQLAQSIYQAIKTYKNQIRQNTTDTSIEVIELQPTETSVPDSSSNPSPSQTNTYIFKIQLATGTKNLETKPQNFKGIKGVTKQKDGQVYRYFVGNTSVYNDIKILLQSVQAKGYKDAYIVAYKGTKKVSVQEALKSK